MRKLKKLKSILKRMGSVLVAYSAGADSTFLLKVAAEVLTDKVLAVTADSPTYPAGELEFSKRMTRFLRLRHKIIKTGELRDKRFIRNPVNRCYFCKRELFSRLKEIAKINKLNFVVDASTFSDRRDYRPGNKAKKELNVRSPLAEAGFTKEEIRRLSKKMGLVTWDKPALACLASRVPYGIRISPQILSRIDNSERFLRQLGFKQVRVRHLDRLCRIEVPPQEIPSLIGKRRLVAKQLKKMGYYYITVDLEGYRTGSLNAPLRKTANGGRAKKERCRKKSLIF